MAKAKVKLNSAGVVALLTSNEVTAELEARMARVAATYGEAHVETHRHKDRNVVQVWSDKPNALYREAHSGDLARAFDAAGGTS